MSERGSTPDKNAKKSALPPSNKKSGTETAEDRRAGTERRAAIDRRSGISKPPSEGERRSGKDRRSKLDRRRGPGIRRTEYRRSAEEGEMTEEQLAFIMAVDEYKHANNRPHLTLTELLDLVLYLGYRKVAEPGEFKLSGRKEKR
jgi:hypothetical protein